MPFLYIERYDVAVKGVNNDFPLLANALESVHNGDPVSLDRMSRISRNLLFGLGVVSSTISKVFIVPIALDVGGYITKNDTWAKVIGVASAICNIKAFWLFESWLSYQIAQDIFPEKTQKERVLSRSGECISGSAKFAFCVAFAAFSQLAIGLAAGVYNPKHRNLAISVTLLSSLFIPIRNMQLTTERILGKMATHFSAGARLKKAMIKVLKSDRSVFISNSAHQNESLGAAVALGKVNEMVEVLDEPAGTQSAKKVSCSCISANPGYWLGWVLTGISLYALGDYTYIISKNKLGFNKGIAGLFAAANVASSFYLYGTFIPNTCAKITKGMASGSCSLRNRSAPLSAFILEESISNVFALGPTIVIWGKFFKNPLPRHWLMLTAMTASLWVVLETSTLAMANGLEKWMGRQIEGNSEEEQNKIARCTKLILKAKKSELTTYLRQLSFSTQKAILKAGKIDELTFPLLPAST